MKKTIVMIAVMIIAGIADNAHAQKWMQYNQMYPVGRNTSKMRLPNGTSVYSIIDGQNYLDPQTKAWKRHSFQFVPLGNGKYMYRADYDFITGKFYDDEFTMANNNVWVSWIPIGANSSHVKIKGDTAYYNNVYTGIKAVRVITADGIKEYLRVAIAGAARDSFEYVCRTNAAKIKKNGNYFLLYDENEALQLAVPKVKYWDAKGVEREGVYKWKRIPNGDYYVTMKVDYSDLTFPVIIDPTTSITDTSMIKDGYVSGGTATSKGTAYGANNFMGLFNQGAILRRAVRYWDLSAIAESKVLSYIDSLYSSQSKWTTTGKQPENWRIVWYPLTRSFYETTFNWYRRNNTSTDSTWVKQGIVPNNRVTSDIDTTYKAKFKAILPGTIGWKTFSEDSADISALPLFLAWTSGTLTNNGFVMMLDSAGYDSSYFDQSNYIEEMFYAKEAGANAPRLWLTTIPLTPCTLSVVDTNSVSGVIDTVRGRIGPTVMVSIYNATLGRYYAIKSSGRVVLVDTIYATAQASWSNKRIPLKPNADNFLLTVTEVAGITYDSTIQIQRVGNPSAISILELADTLFFRLYDETNQEWKFFRVDSVIIQSREMYTYQEQPIFALAWLSDFKDYIWRDMRKRFEQWNQRN